MSVNKVKLCEKWAVKHKREKFDDNATGYKMLHQRTGVDILGGIQNHSFYEHLKLIFDYVFSAFKNLTLIELF